MLEHRDGHDRVTKNVRDIGARSKHCDSDQKRRSRVRESSEQCDSDQKHQSRSDQNMIHDKNCL